MSVDDLGQVHRILRQHLESWQRAGLSELPRCQESCESRTGEQQVSACEDSEADVSGSLGSQPAIFDTLEETAVSQQSVGELSREQRQERLQALARQVATCSRCQELAEARTQTVFGVGDPEAEIMFVGEAPGADEDRQGEPFVGKAGQLLDRIIVACELQRDEVYICNILKCRPPGNRNPSSPEAANCREYLDAQIATVSPSYIICLGGVAAQNLLETTESIGRMRQKFYKYAGAKVVCTYHPSYLLRNPAKKKDVWEDMKFFRRDMGVELG